jgi:hypothetical protein
MKLEGIDKLTGLDVIMIREWVNAIENNEINTFNCPFGSNVVWKSKFNKDEIIRFKVAMISKGKNYQNYCYADVCYSFNELHFKYESHSAKENCPCQRFNNNVLLIKKVRAQLNKYKELANEKVREFLVDLKEFRGEKTK